MLGVLALALLALLVTTLVRNYLAFSKNLQAAKVSGLPYVTTPISNYNRYADGYCQHELT